MEIDNINYKIYIISQILDLFDAKLYKYFPTKRLRETKRKLNDKLVDLFVYNVDTTNTPPL
jgi:hypothetical protein